MAIYLESLSSTVHFSFNHAKELELSYNCVMLQVKVWDRFFPQWFKIYGHTQFERWSVNSSSL